VQQGLSKQDGLNLLSLIAAGPFYKVNFAGGEPLLNKHLGDYLRAAKEMGLKTSIITNASRLTFGWLQAHGRFIDQIGVSCDSLDDNINKELGRGFGNHVAITKRAFESVRELNESMGLEIKIKLNTVVMRPNYLEDWNDFIQSNGIQRWKIFKILKIKGENDAVYDKLAIGDAEFEEFVARHAKLSAHEVVLAPETNDDMTSSYIMITPDGKFYQNADGKYDYSDSMLQIGVEAALRQVGFDYTKFQKRGGEYKLD